MPEKDSYEMMELEKSRTESALYDDPSRMYDDLGRNTAERGLPLDEAADMYGDVKTAEEHGYVSRGLKSRHVQFLALGGTIGTGLFLGIGRAFTTAGPLSLFLGYCFTGTAVFAMMQSLGEMTTWLPLPGAIPQFCARYVDGAMGFAVGWNNWYSNCLILCAEIAAAGVVVQFWNGAEEINVAAWITIVIVVVVALNTLAVSIYGEAEFVFASIKIITIIGLIIFAFIIDLGGGPTRDRLGFRYWKNPGAMKPYVADGDLGRFLGLFSTLVNAAFSYSGVEICAVAAGETENPRRNIPKAVRRVFWRILFFYVIGSLAIGVLIPYNESRLLDAIHHDSPGGAASPWVIAIYRAGVPVLPSIINAVILISATSAANAFLYTGSRYLYALAQNGQAPRFLLTCSRKGIPYWCIAITASVSLLSYMSCTAGSQKVFQWFQNLSSITALLTWMSVSIAYIRFYSALRAQGISRDTLVFKSPGQPYTAWFSLCFFAVVLVFNGFYTFPSKTKKFDRNDFITAYAGLVMYGVLFVFWKVFKRTRWVKPEEADIQTGKAALDVADGHWPDRIANNWWEKICLISTTRHNRKHGEFYTRAYGSPYMRGDESMQDASPFTKLVKNSAYYSRYQTKYKRRRAGKTDYYARKRLITQAKNKYNAPKYRLVVRFTNKDIICQIVTSEITGDKVFCAAYGHELKRYGVKHGLTNWAAAYCVGLLIARRALSKLELADTFTGVEEADGEYKLTEAAEHEGEDRRPFKCFLDVGLARTSTGSKVFGAMKGASDGGIFIPHSENRFPGYDIESKELDAETLRKYIFGGHVAEYMETLADDDEERYKSQFQGYIDDEIEADGLEEMYQEAHKAIREDPFMKDEEEGEKKSKDEWKAESKKHKLPKMSYEEKQERVKAKIEKVKESM